MGQPSYCPHQSSPILASVYIDIHDVCRQVCVCPIPSAVSPATPATLIPRVSQIPPTSIPIWMGASSLGRASSATSSFRSGHLIQHATTWRADTSSVYSLHMLTSSSFCGHGNVQQFVQFLFSVSYHFCNITISMDLLRPSAAPVPVSKCLPTLEFCNLNIDILYFQVSKGPCNNLY